MSEPEIFISMELCILKKLLADCNAHHSRFTLYATKNLYFDKAMNTE